MTGYRPSKPLAGIPIGDTKAITIPAGSVIEKDGFVAAVGLTVVVWGGRRITFAIQDVVDGGERMCETAIRPVTFR